jgi:nucleoside 2-deoxyribosyltransferase
MKKKSVYCSGAMFSPEDISAMAQIATVLEKSGYSTFLPHRDGLEPFVVNYIGSPLTTSIFFRPLNKLVNKWLFSYDIYQIVERCDYFVFNMNGRVPDEGGVVETGVAFAFGKPVILYKNDDRTLSYGYDNPMLLGASGTFSTVNDIVEIPASLELLAEKMESPARNMYAGNNIPPEVKKANDLGRKVDRYVKAFQFLKPKNKLLEKIKP